MPLINQIYLTEHESTRFPHDMLTPAQGRALWQSYDLNGRKLTVTFPSPKTNEQWEIAPTNWVGTIPISPQLHLNIQPKTPLQNIFRMWEYAYRLHQFHFFDDLVQVETIQDFFNHLAAMLSRLVLRRARLGLHRAYVQHETNLAFVRGRLTAPNHTINTTPTLRCQFDDYTVDISDNQLLLFTLDQIARSGTCRPETQQVVRQA
ncbi:MAG: hypothetical protein KC421_30270, partial [Anaerolineales bacterium]|nr:hypothetical protein [Anaerolineales bacterium]